MFVTSLSSAREVYKNAYAALNEAHLDQPLSLYTWVDFDELTGVVANIDQNNRFFRFPRLDGSNLQQFRFLEGRTGVFAFHNVFAFRAGKRESYGNHLIRYTLKKNSRILYVKSFSDTYAASIAQVTNGEFDVKPYDAVYIQKPLNEWIILNPESLESFTASPEEMKAELEQSLLRLADSNFRLSPEDTHTPINTEQMRGIIRRLLEGVLERKEHQIPSKFKLSHNTQMRSLSGRLSYEEYMALILETIRKIPDLKFTPSSKPQYLGKDLMLGVLYWLHHNLLRYPLQTVRTLTVPYMRELMAPGSSEPPLVEKTQGTMMLQGVQIFADRIEGRSILQKLYSAGEVQFFGRWINSMDQLIHIIADVESLKEAATIDAFTTGQLQLVLAEERRKAASSPNVLLEQALERLFRVCNSDPETYAKVLKKYGIAERIERNSCSGLMI